MFLELSKVLAITIVTTGFVLLLKQPAIIGYILSGILAGPSLFNIIQATTTLETFSHIGVALLLFFVGLSLNPKVIKDVGRVALLTGIGQVVFTSGIGFLIVRALGYSLIASVYIAVALAFSSTIIIMKLLSDKRDLDSLYGKISVGFLIVQDFIAIIILLVISSSGSGASLSSVAIESILKASGAMLILFLLTVYFLPKLTSFIAKNQEYLLLFSISWCFVIASAFFYLNLSIEVGALLAGMTLSMSPYQFEISSKMKPLRDFFIVLFFIMLGSEMVFANVLDNIGVILITSFFVLIGNPIIVMIIMGSMGYTKRNSFLSGLTVAQISEFSLIVITMAIAAGHIPSEVLSLVTAVGLITFTGSTYMILYSNQLYSFLSPYLSVFEKKGKKVDEKSHHKHKQYDVILFGYNRIGFDVLRSLKKLKKKFLVVDFNPEIIAQLSEEGYDCKYGDANNDEFLNEINLTKAKMIISTIPTIETNLLLLYKIRSVNKKAIISVVSHQIEESLRLYEAGATYVVMPHFLGGNYFSTMIENNKLNIKKFLKERLNHLDHLEKRKALGHKHPRNEHH